MNILPPDVPDTTVEIDVPTFWSITSEALVLVQLFALLMQRVSSLLWNSIGFGFVLSFFLGLVCVVLRFLSWLF